VNVMAGAAAPPQGRPWRDAVWRACRSIAVSMMARRGHCPPDQLPDG
jgi:hypothetical protein